MLGSAARHSPSPTVVVLVVLAHTLVDADEKHDLQRASGDVRKQRKAHALIETRNENDEKYTGTLPNAKASELDIARKAPRLKQRFLEIQG